MINSITFSSIVKQSDGSWLFSWADTLPIYYRVIFYGSEIARTNNSFYKYAIPGYDVFPPALEVMEGDALSLSEQFKPFVQIQWYAEDCEYYLLQEFVDGNWVFRKRLMENGSTVYTVITPILVDGNTYEYGVLAYKNGKLSSIQEFQVNMISLPLPIDNTLSVSYDSATNNIVVAGT